MFDMVSLKDFKSFLEEFRASSFNTKKVVLPVDEIIDDVKCGNKKLHGMCMDKWYESIHEDFDNPAYWVYGEPLYLGEVIYCWKKYSRVCVRRNLPKLNLKDVHNILDLGCGIGFTSIVMSEIFSCDVQGTNIPDTLQYDINKFVFDKYGNGKCHIVDDNLSASGKFDIVFASEFFEHVTSPIRLLNDVLDKYEPRYIIFSNSFHPKALGHFNRYFDMEGNIVDSKTTSKLFRLMLLSHDYEKVPTDFYNNRPTVYRKRVVTMTRLF